MISDWRELPFGQIWCVDTEFYPGRGYDNGGVDGDPITPLCLVAIEMRTGRIVRFWQDELGRFPPYPLDGNSLIVSYALAAEFGFHIACGWGEPAASIDALVEFRHHTNDGSIMPGQRDKKFYSLSNALHYFGLDTLDTDHKDEMTKRILRGPPFTGVEKQIVQYCEDDTRALTRLFSALVRTIKSLPHALHRAKFQWQSALMESRGVPIDGEALRRLKLRWNGIQTSLVNELDRDYGCYEIVDCKPKWRKHLFAAYLRRNSMTWPRLASGAYNETDETFRSMSGLYSRVETLRELRYTLSKLKLNALAVGGDNRNRSPYWAYGTKSARCAPSNSKFVFGNAKWLRFLISPAPEMALVHRDYSQQEPRIGAVLSDDMELLAACESGDVYTGIARQLGFYDDRMDDEKKKSVRAMFKRVVLAVQYGSGCDTLALWTGISRTEAAEILARLRARFRRFEAFTAANSDRAGLLLELTNPLGWTMQCPPEINPRLLRNFPIQSAGSAVLHVACILAARRGVRLVASVHDALMAEGPVDQVEDLSRELNRLMGDAGAVILKGYRLPTDKQIIRPGERYFDDRGEAMWRTVSQLADNLERADGYRTSVS